jgi:hypothetical protein
LNEALAAFEALMRFRARTMQRWIFNSRNDAKTCDECQDLDGQTFEIADIAELGEEFPYGEAEGQDLFRPYVHPNCRCEIILVEVYWEPD